MVYAIGFQHAVSKGPQRFYFWMVTFAILLVKHRGWNLLERLAQDSGIQMFLLPKQLGWPQRDTRELKKVLTAVEHGIFPLKLARDYQIKHDTNYSVLVPPPTSKIRLGSEPGHFQFCSVGTDVRYRSLLHLWRQKRVYGQRFLTSHLWLESASC